MYTFYGEDMTIYLDLVFLLNLFFDFLLLLTVNNTLKRNASLKRIFLGACVGSLSIFTLFFPFTTFLLFCFKIIMSIFMCVISFGLKDKLYTIQNISYFYMTSTVLGGFLYFLNLNFSETHEGMVFTYQTISIPYLFVVISSPIMLYVYFRQRKSEANYQHYYKVTITFLNGEKQTFSSYLDTGNKLVDPITKKKVIVIDAKKVENIEKQIYYVPYHSLNHHGLMECFKVNSISINGKVSKNYLIGLSKGDLLRDGVDCVLNSYCLEELL